MSGEVSNRERFLAGSYHLQQRAIKDTEQFNEYLPSAEEKQRRKVPAKFMHLANFYGSFSMGIDRDKKLTMVTAGHESGEMKTLPKDSRQVNKARARRATGARRFWANNLNPKQSAVAYQEKSPFRQYAVKRMQAALARSDFEVAEKVVPFLNTKGDEGEQKALQLQQRMRLAQGQAQSTQVAKRIEFLNGILYRKNAEKIRFIKFLTASLQEAKQGKRGKNLEETAPIWSRFLDFIFLPPVEEEEDKENKEQTMDDEPNRDPQSE